MMPSAYGQVWFWQAALPAPALRQLSSWAAPSSRGPHTSLSRLWPPPHQWSARCRLSASHSCPPTLLAHGEGIGCWGTQSPSLRLPTQPRQPPFFLSLHRPKKGPGLSCHPPGLWLPTSSCAAPEAPVRPDCYIRLSCLLCRFSLLFQIFLSGFT